MDLLLGNHIISLYGNNTMFFDSWDEFWPINIYHINIRLLEPNYWSSVLGERGTWWLNTSFTIFLGQWNDKTNV